MKILFVNQLVSKLVVFDGRFLILFALCKYDIHSTHRWSAVRIFF
jgi:hypothetical protein